MKKQIFRILATTTPTMTQKVLMVSRSRCSGGNEGLNNAEGDSGEENEGDSEEEDDVDVGVIGFPLSFLCSSDLSAFYATSRSWRGGVALVFDKDGVGVFDTARATVLAHTMMGVGGK